MSVETVQVTDRPRSNWLDLLIYLFGGFGLFVLVSLGVGLLVQKTTIWVTALALVLNIVFIGGGVWVWGVLRRKTSWREMGFWPVNWQRKWLPVALGVSVAFIPLRALLGVLVQLLLEGNLDSLQGRTDVLTAGGQFSLLGFLITLIGAGILVPIAEELYFRGLLHRWFEPRLPFWPRVLISSLFFGLAHFDSVGVVASSYVMGVVNAVAYEKSKSLWLPILIHMSTNSIAVLLLYLALWAQQFTG
ncbi:MAG: CPBP family intramembrane metalloprotease [Anaerolineae bacterium]|nr:CPBP family intramembrane metalloprotease [Anaerolineae bacterium]